MFLCYYVAWPCDLDLWPFDLESVPCTVISCLTHTQIFIILRLSVTELRLLNIWSHFRYLKHSAWSESSAARPSAARPRPPGRRREGVIPRKSLKMTDFSKTGSRNMAETCAINFLTLVSYSTSIVIGGLRRLLLAVLMWTGLDLEYFRAETARCSFRGFSNFDRPWIKN